MTEKDFKSLEEREFFVFGFSYEPKISIECHESGSFSDKFDGTRLEQYLSLTIENNYGFSSHAAYNFHTKLLDVFSLLVGCRQKPEDAILIEDNQNPLPRKM